MPTYVSVIAVVVGFVLNELSHVWRGNRERRFHRRDRHEKFLGDALFEALEVIDQAYDAAAAIGLEADQMAVAGHTESAEHWAYRKPFVAACGTAAFHLRRVAVLLSPDESPRTELAALAQVTADMAGMGTVTQLVERWRLVDPAALAAREAVAHSLRTLHPPPRT